MKPELGRIESAALALATVVETPAGEATLASAKVPPLAGEWNGDRAGRYWLRHELGAGGMGRVYEAFDPDLERRVAVKLLHSSVDPEWLSREARALAKLSHPNVVAVYDVGTFRGRAFVAMELVEGRTLRQWVTDQPRTLEDVMSATLQAGRGLSAAHAAGLLHRDFKPDNVMVGLDGRVRVLDFGLVHGIKKRGAPSPAPAPADERAALTTLVSDENAREISAVDSINALAGTPAYMAPEQLCGEQMTPATDQFSFCVSLWELLYGQRPFVPEKLLELGLGIRRGAPLPQAPLESGWVPNWLRRVLEKGLAIDATERHRSMVALLDALEAGLARAAAERQLLGRRYEMLSAASGASLPGSERALDRFTGRLVTIKRLAPSPDAASSVTLGQLGDAFRQCASLRHPNLIGVLDFGLDSGGAAYWVLDLKDDGTSLLTALHRADARPAIDYVVELLQVIRYLHKHGVFLGALDPAMIVVTRDQLRLAPTRLLLSASAVSTPSRAGDLRAFAAFVLEHVARGGGDSADAAGERVAPAPLEFDRKVVQVLERVLEQNPVEHYRSADELARALDSATGLSSTRLTPEGRESLLRAGPFLGRDEELATLTNAVQAACDGQGAAWLVTGESGVGKSRLLDEIASLGVVEGALVLRGHEEREGGSPYRLFREVLRGLSLLTQLDEVEASVLAPVVPNLEKILARPIASAPELDALSTHGRLVEVVKKLLLRQPQPIIMLLEDVQWARSDSLDLLQQLAKAAAGSTTLIVATARDDAPPRFREQLRALSSMQLGRLSRAAIARLAEAMLGDTARQPALLDLLERETEGNAFFLVEVVRALAEAAGGLEKIGENELPDKVFAGGVQSVVQQRLRAVSGPARALLGVAAVSGRRLEPRLLARLLPDADLESSITKCIEAAILEHNGEELRFRHDKLREGLLATLTDGERAAQHARVAEAMELEHAGEPEFYAAIAQHFGHAENLGKEAHYAALAGDYALLHGAVREAIELLERARIFLASGRDAQALARVCVTLGDAHYLMMDMSQAMACAAQGSAALGVRFPSGAFARNLALFWQLLLHVGYRVWPRLAARGDATERAAMQVASAAAGCAATVNISQSNALGVLLYSLMAWNLGERAQSRNLWASGVLGYGLATLGYGDLARSYFASTDRGARALDGSYAVVKTGYLMGIGDLEAAEALMQEGLELAPRTGFYRAEAFRWFLLGYCAYFRGDLEEADKRFALAAANEGTRANFAPGLALVRCIQGQLAEAEVLLAEALQEANPAAPRSIALAVLALIQTRRGEPRLALGSADRAVAVAAGGNTFGYAGAAYFTGVFETYLAELRQAKKAGRDCEQVLLGLERVTRHGRVWAKAFPIGRPLLLFYTGKQAQIMTDTQQAQRLLEESEQLARSLHIGPYTALAARGLPSTGGDAEPSRRDSASKAT